MEKQILSLGNVAVILTIATLFSSLIFVLFPQIDIFVSGLFANTDSGFLLADSRFFTFMRTAYLGVMWVFFALALVMFFWSLGLGATRRIPLAVWGFPVAVSIIGPLVLVNGILKAYWGRARPANITEFGGTLEFSPAFYISDQCATNCSFTSGEGAGIAAVTIIIGVLLWSNIKRRGLLVTGLALVFLVGAGLRVIKGRHFLSDTILSALFCALIAVFFYWLFNIAAHRQKLTRKNIAGDFGRPFHRFRKNSSRK